MPEPASRRGPPVAPRQAVATAIQDLVAARLGRGFVPVAVIFLSGLVALGTGGLTDRGGWALSMGALAAAGAMLAHGQRIVQDAFGRPPSPWLAAARWGSLVPLLFGLYVLGWRGLRQLALGQGSAGLLLGIGFAALGTWVLRAWTRVMEVEKLARFMTVGLEGGGEGA